MCSLGLSSSDREPWAVHDTSGGHLGASLETSEPLHVRQLWRPWPWHAVQAEMFLRLKRSGWEPSGAQRLEYYVLTARYKTKRGVLL